MKYVTSVERLAIERGMEKGLAMGLEKGIEQGIEQGIERGIEQGIAQGQIRGIARALSLQLERRFGPLSADLTQRLSQATTEQLDLWLTRVLDADTLDEIFTEN